MKILLIIGILMVAPYGAYGYQLCFNDKASYEQVRVLLPEFLRQDSLILVHQSRQLLAGVYLYPQSKVFRLELHMWHSLWGADQSEDEVQQVCYRNNKAHVHLKSGVRQTIVVHDHGVEIKGYQFIPTLNKQEFTFIVEQIGQKVR